MAIEFVERLLPQIISIGSRKCFVTYKLRKDRRENIINARENFDDMSDADLEKTVDNEIIFRQNELEILKKYHPQFKKILPIKKVAKLYKSEEDFKRRLLDMIQDRREDRRDGQRQGSPPNIH